MKRSFYVFATVWVAVCSAFAGNESVQADPATVSICLGESATLSASVEADLYKWNTDDNTRSITVSPDALGTYTYEVTSYKSVVTPERNLMQNGDFESITGFSSDYTLATCNANTTGMYNTTQWDYYEQSGSKTNGVYALVQNAHNFWRDYVSIAPHGGNYYGLFDAKSVGYAWKASLDSGIEKDSVYHFSYWAAHPNSKDFSNSPAELQFVVIMDGIQVDLGTPVKLSTADNQWHQQLVTWTAPRSSNNVEIGVYDKNNNGGVGNDFCLDDILFQKLTYTSSVVEGVDKFTVVVSDCSDCTGPEMYAKWNDVIFVDNTDDIYVAYQWYCNGAAIPGATKQYLYDANGLSGVYYVEMTKQDGTRVRTCEKPFSEIQHSAPLNAGSGQKQVYETRTYQVGTTYHIVQTIYTDGSFSAEKQTIR